MSETDTTRPNDQWQDNTLTDNQQRNRDSAALIPVTRSGAIPMNFAQMVDYAKFMSTARGAVGAHFMNNVGACLAVMEIANQFGLPAYAVARQSYLVNNRIAFMGQFFHSIIEDYAPLKKGANGRKLQWKYEGEGPTLKIIVWGTFEGASEPVDYESPTFAEIKVKNSPLWQTEVKRQFIYFGVRGWQTINWPEGMMHAISEDEAAALPPSEYARDITPVTEAAGLRDRLAAARNAEHPGQEREGFRAGFTEGHFTEVEAAETKSTAVIEDTIEHGLDAAKGHAIAADVGADPKPEGDTRAPGDLPDPPAAKPKAARKPRTAKEQPTDAPQDEPKASDSFPGDTPLPAPEKPAELPKPKTAVQWAVYARAWLMSETDFAAMRKRWSDEMKMRNDLGVTQEIRDPVFEYYQQRLAELEGRA